MAIPASFSSAVMDAFYVLVYFNLFFFSLRMRGIMSQAMVMCSANEDRSKFELLDPPAGCAPGDRVTFEGFPGEPDKQLNPKKKVNTATVNYGYNGHPDNTSLPRRRY